MTDAHGGPVPQNLTEWRERVLQRIQQPDRLTRATYRKLSPAAREVYDTDRVSWIATPHVIQTPHLEKIRKDTRRVIRMQTASTPTFRNTSYVIVSGEAGVGKTTTCLRVGIEHERAVRARRRCTACPDCDRPSEGDCDCARCVDNVKVIDTSIAPVAYLEVQGGTTPKQLMQDLCDFTGQTWKSSFNTKQLTDKARSSLAQLGTSLVILDEIQNVKPKSTTGAETADALKAFAGSLPAAFMYVGVNLTGDEDLGGYDGLFAGDTGQMIAARAQFTKLDQFGHSTTDEKETWDGIIDSFEETLPLLDHKLGTLGKQADHLWELTGGSLNSLWRLLSNSALDAIDDGTERITREQLTFEALDKGAQDRFRSRAIGVPARSTPAARRARA